MFKEIAEDDIAEAFLPDLNFVDGAEEEEDHVDSHAPSIVHTSGGLESILETKHRTATRY